MIAVLLSGAVVAGVLAGLPSSSAATGQVLLVDDFTRADADVIGNGWVQTGTATGVARLRGGEVRIDTRDDAFAPVATRAFTPVTTGIVQWSFAMDFTRIKAESTYELRMQLLDSAVAQTPATSARAGVAVDLRWGGPRPGAADQVLAVDTGAASLTPVGLAVGPTTVTVRADLDADTALISVAGATGPVASTTVALPAAAGVDAIRYYATGLNDRNFANRSFDDIKVETLDSPTATTTTTGGPTTTTTGPTTTTTTTGPTTTTTTTGPTTTTTTTGPTTTTTTTGPTTTTTTTEPTTTTTTTEPTTTTTTTTEPTTTTTQPTTTTTTTQPTTTTTTTEPTTGSTTTTSTPTTSTPTASTTTASTTTASTSTTTPGGGPTPFTGVLMSDSFNRTAAAVLGPPWTEIEDSTNQVAGNGTAMSFTSNDGANIPLARANFERQTQGTVTWNFLFNWKRTGTEGTFGVVMRLADAPPAGAGTGTTAAELVWGGVNPLGMATDLGFGYRVAGVTTQIGVVNAPTPVRVIADLATHTYSLDLNPSDGRVEATGIPLAGTGINAVEYRTIGASTPKFLPAGFDDVSVSVIGGTTGGSTPTTTTTSRTSAPGSSDNIVTISGNRILVNGVPTKLTGIRTGSAALSDDLTNQLIANMPVYKSYGVNSFAVYYMGSRGNQAWPFYENGTTVDPLVQERMNRIIDAADDLDMIPVIGIFFQGPRPQVNTAQGVFNIVHTVARELERHDNIIINVMNEQNTGGYSPYAGFYDFRIPDLAMNLCDVYNEVDPTRIIGVGGYAPSNNEIIAVDPRCDVLFANNGDSGERYDRYVAKGMTKPMINPEILGQTLQPVTGVFDDALKDTYNENLDDAAVRPGLNVFFHNRQWTQNKPYRYDLGGNGTAADPGIRWWFEHALLVNPPLPAG